MTFILACKRKEVTELVSPPTGKDGTQKKVFIPRSRARTLSLVWLEKSGTLKDQSFAGHDCNKEAARIIQLCRMSKMIPMTF